MKRSLDTSRVIESTTTTSSLLVGKKKKKKKRSHVKDDDSSTTTSGRQKENEENSFEDVTKEEEEEAEKGVRMFKKRIETKSLHIINETFPLKIDMMQKLYLRFHKEQFKYADSTREKFTNIPSNEHIETLYLLMKKEILEMVDLLNHLRLWLRLKVPKVQTGNNFRTEILAEVLQMLGSGRTSGLSVLEVVAKYFLRRAKYISDAKKFPRAIDQARQVADLDEKQYICMIQAILGLRNTFMLLLDKFKKNFDRILETEETADRNAEVMVF